MDCDLSLHDTAVSLLNYPATWHLNGGFLPQRTRHSAHPSLVPFQLFETADGWIVVGCAKEKFWRRLAAAIGMPELAGDPRFGTFAARRDHKDELLAVLEPRFQERTSDLWLQTLVDAGVPCGPVNDVPAALRDPQIASRGLLVETDHPWFGRIKQLASPVRVGKETITHRRAPMQNEDYYAILSDLLEYEDERIARLQGAGALADAPFRLANETPSGAIGGRDTAKVEQPNR